MVKRTGDSKIPDSTAFITMLAVLAGCSTGTASNDSESALAAGRHDKEKKIIVGTGTQFPNVCFIDENGKLTGYDVELIREIDKRLPSTNSNQHHGFQKPAAESGNEKN